MEGEEKGEEEEVSEKMRRRKGWEWREMGDRGEGRREKILGDQRCRTRDTSFGTQKAVSTKSNPGREAKRAKKKNVVIYWQNVDAYGNRPRECRPRM